MTPTQKAVEAAARAIYEDRNGKGCKPWSLQPKTHKEPYISDSKAAITAYLAALAVDGLCLVSKEPTYEMVDAGVASLGSDDDRNSTSVACDAWAAMLAASTVDSPRQREG